MTAALNDTSASMLDRFTAIIDSFDRNASIPVSYTHLTLPTILLV